MKIIILQDGIMEKARDCRSCGHSISSEAKVCPSCRATDPFPFTDDEREARNAVGLIVVLGILIFLVIIIGILTS